MECIKCKKEIPDGAPYCCWCGKKQEAQRNRTRGNGQGNAYQRGKTWTARWTEKTYLDENDKLHQKMKTKGGFMPRSNMPPTRRKKSGEALHSEHTTRRICAEITCPCRRTGRVQRKKLSSA